MKEKLSASAQQFEERREKLIYMLTLAREETKELIKQLLYETPPLTVEGAINLVKRKPIRINPFIREFMSTLYGNGTSYKTAKDYFETHSERLRPVFIRVRLVETSSRLNAFHLNEPLICDSFWKAKMELDADNKKSLKAVKKNE